MSLVTTKEPANTSEDHSRSNRQARHVAAKNYEMLMQHHQFLNVSGTSMHPSMENLAAFDGTLGSSFQLAPQCRVETFDFKMWVNPPAPDNQRHEALHVCTALPHDAQRAATPLEHIPNWRSLYPDLAPISEDAEFDGNLVFMESKLDLMTDSPPTGSRLGIDFFARIANGSAYEVWDYTTVFYEKGRCVHDCSGELRFNVEGSSECVGTTKLEMSLESSWWVKFFFKASERRRVREARGDLNGLQQVDETTRQSLKEMTIMQEIWASSYAKKLPRKRVAVLLWKFRQVRPGEAATTRWRNLIPPPPRITTNSPAPAILESQMTLDASINSHMHQPVAIYTDPFHQQSLDSFADRSHPSSNPQNFDDYPTSGDAFPGPSGTIDYSMSEIHVEQEDLGSVDLSEGHINLYCQPYSQPPPAYGGHAQFVASEGVMEGSFDDDEWAAMCAHPGFSDVDFDHEHGNVPLVANRSEHGVGDFTDVGFEHLNIPDITVKLEHDTGEFTDVSFGHDSIVQVTDRSEHAGGECIDVGFEHAKLPDVPERLGHDNDDFTDVGFQQETIPQVVDRLNHRGGDFTDVGLEHANLSDVPVKTEHDNEDFTDVGFQQETQVADGQEHDSHRFTEVPQYENFTQAVQNAGHGIEQFTDGSLEHPNLPNVSEKSSHGNDDFTDVGFEHAHSPEVPENPSHRADIFTDVGFEHTNLPDGPEKPSHGTNVFTDVDFEHVSLPDLPQASQHDNDSDYEHIQVRDFAMSFD